MTRSSVTFNMLSIKVRGAWLLIHSLLHRMWSYLCHLKYKSPSHPVCLSRPTSAHPWLQHWRTSAREPWRVLPLRRVPDHTSLLPYRALDSFPKPCADFPGAGNNLSGTLFPAISCSNQRLDFLRVPLAVPQNLSRLGLLLKCCRIYRLSFQRS